jgi:hypothetical protein
LIYQHWVGQPRPLQVTFFALNKKRQWHTIGVYRHPFKYVIVPTSA